MGVTPHGPEPCASANSAIPADKFGGWGWIRTIVGCANGFTVRSLWPLGNPSTDKMMGEYEVFNGAGDGTRTRNLLITNQLLCQLSYTSMAGASEWSRTTDTGIFSPLLYQLSYRGKNGDPEGARTPDLQRDRLAF